MMYWYCNGFSISCESMNCELKQYVFGDGEVVPQRRKSSASLQYLEVRSKIYRNVEEAKVDESRR